jgi:NifB/MoaA-like Fe-S oxidoreductase
MMVVPEKENWRHVFDLTKFNQRPEKLDPKTYRDRVRRALLTKVRIHHDLTRDEMAMRPPPEVQAMIGDPRLVELAYSQSRMYTPQELRKLMQTIRRWGKNN